MKMDKGRRNKRLKLGENEDRISSLPDSLLHHILSFFPSTVQAIQTGILSKRWKNQWTHVSSLKILSDAEMGGLSYPWVNNMIIMTLNCPNFEHHSGILCAIRSSPMLERLVIELQAHEFGPIADLLDLNDSRDSYWNSNRTVSNCLLSLLRTSMIAGLSKQHVKYKIVLDFIEFLLKNARVLEKLVLVITKEGGTNFAFQVSQKVSSFTRCSQHAAVELLCS